METKKASTSKKVTTSANATKSKSTSATKKKLVPKIKMITEVKKEPIVKEVEKPIPTISVRGRCLGNNNKFTYIYSIKDHLVYTNNSKPEYYLLLNINTGLTTYVYRSVQTGNCQFSVYVNLRGNIDNIRSLDNKMTFEDAVLILMQLYYHQSCRMLIYFHLRQTSFSTQELQYLEDNPYFKAISITKDINTRASTQQHMLVEFYSSTVRDTILEHSKNFINQRYFLWSTSGYIIFLPMGFNNKFAGIENASIQLKGIIDGKYFDSPDDYSTIESKFSNLVNLQPQLKTIQKDFIKEFEEKALTFKGEKVKIVL